MNNSPVYDVAVFSELIERTQYELWLLEAVYDISDAPLRPEFPDQMVYPPDGAAPKVCGFGYGNAIIGDWRPKFMEVGAPLVFVTSFKVLDMVLEWILEKNGGESTWRFQQKIHALKKPIEFPPFLKDRNWLRERAISLYEHLEPLRGTIIHQRHFKSVDGALTISSSKKGTVGPEVPISKGQVGQLARFVVSLVRYITDEWRITPYREKLLRCAVDALQNLHGMTLLGQQLPLVVTVRVYQPWDDSITVNADRVRGDIERYYPGRDVECNIRAIMVSSDRKAKGYLFQGIDIASATKELVFRSGDSEKHACEIPDDVDLSAIARVLYRQTEEDKPEDTGSG